MPPSALPEQSLAEHLVGSRFFGTFESHITIDSTDQAQREQFRDVCHQLGVKCVLIELAEGVTRSQPMTACYHHGAVDRVVEELAAQCRGLRAAGFSLARVKLEAVAANEGVPDSDEEAAGAPATNYFEFHVKLLLAQDADLGALRTCCDRHAARLSRNTLKTEHDGRSQRFVTMRAYGIGRHSAFARLEALEHDLATAGFVVTNRQREYTIFDSAERLDAGWINAPDGPGASR